MSSHLRTLLTGALVVLFVSFMLPAYAGGAANGAWPMFHHDALHTGLSPFTGPGSPTLQWTFSTGGEVYEGDPAVGADGTIYIGSRSNKLYAVNPDGSQKWVFPTGNAVECCPAIGADGTIYVDAPTNFYAINPDGTQKWVLSGGGYSSPVIGTDGTIYSVAAGGLSAINPNGTIKWTTTIGGTQSAPALGTDGTLYIGSDDDNLYAINADGSLKWKFTTGSYVMSSPSIGADGTIYVGSSDDYIYAVNPDGTQKWSFLTKANAYSSPALGTDGTIYMGSQDGNLYALNPNGGQKWVFATRDAIYSAPAIGADGTLYVGSYDDSVYAVNPDGTQQWEYDTGDAINSSPAIGANGIVYIGSYDGNLYAIGVLTPTFTITPTAGVNGSISPNSVQQVNSGGSLTFTATPNTGCTVNTWSVDGTEVQIGGTTYTLSDITANHTVLVTFSQSITAYTITPTAGANGSISPNTVQTVTSGSSQTFTATPNSGYTVNNWSVDGTVTQSGGTAFTLANITANHTVLVTFTQSTYTVTPLAGANGSVSPNTAQTVNSGGSLSLTAIPNTGYMVNTWSVDGTVVQTGGTSFTLSDIIANHSVLVTFAQAFTVTPTAGPNGVISPSSAQTVASGSSLTFTAMPNAGYAVAVWSLDGEPAQTGGTTFTLSNITASHTVQVTFIVLTFTITPSAGADGAISPNSAQTATYGSSLTFTAIQNTGYAVCNWSVDGTVQQTGGTTFTLTNITANHSVLVTFNTQACQITPSAGANGSISPNCIMQVAYGISLTFTALPHNGYTVNAWSLDGAVVQNGGSTFTLVNITTNHTVQVTFIRLFTLTPSTGFNGAISPNTAQQVIAGSNFTFTATPNSGYMVNTWTLDGKVAQTGGATFTLTNITANHSVLVTFTLSIATYTVTPTAGANGSISPNTPQTVNSGGNLTFTATPNAGYTVADWVVDGMAPLSAGSTTFTLTNITANHTVQVTFTHATFSAVALTALPASPQPVNTAITLTAVPTGIAQVQYLFRVGYIANAVWNWTTLTDGYTSTSSCTWTPVSPGTYTLVVWARIVGHTANYDQFAEQGYQVTTPPFTAVALSASPTSPQPVNTAITLTATPTGGSQLQYLFRVGYSDAAGWHWTNLTAGYTSIAACTWTPVSSGTYMLVVWARMVGHTASYDQYAASSYQVTAVALTGVTLSANPASPQQVNTAITLTAVPTGGGGQVQYLFRVGYSNTAVWHWTNLTAGYTSTAACTWTPATTGTYMLVVWARIIGHTANYDQYAASSYQVTAAVLTGVALSVNPASPQPVNTPITLTATPTGGGPVQYLFRVGYANAAGWQWTNLTASYTTTASCTWTPATASNYTLVVWARVVGHAASYDKYAAISYQVTAPPAALAP